MKLFTTITNWFEAYLTHLQFFLTILKKIKIYMFKANRDNISKGKQDKVRTLLQKLVIRQTYLKSEILDHLEIKYSLFESCISK